MVGTMVKLTCSGFGVSRDTLGMKSVGRLPSFKTFRLRISSVLCPLKLKHFSSKCLEQIFCLSGLKKLSHLLIAAIICLRHLSCSTETPKKKNPNKIWQMSSIHVNKRNNNNNIVWNQDRACHVPDSGATRTDGIAPLSRTSVRNCYYLPINLTLGIHGMTSLYICVKCKSSPQHSS